MTTHTPTDEQQAARDLFATGDDLVIEAGAGTGKTTTLGMMARDTHRNGTYLAFNKAIAVDAGAAMPMNVTARTVHSVAWRALQQQHRDGRALLDRTRHNRIAPWAAAKALRLGYVAVDIPTPLGATRRKVLQPSWQASHIMRAIAVFCNSADDQPGTQHFPYVDGIDPHDEFGCRGTFNNRQLSRELLPALRRAWTDLTSPMGELRFTHDVYLKMAQLNRYEIPGEFILFDEAQDASPVMLAWLTAQNGKQVIYVGDSCQPTGTQVVKIVRRGAGQRPTVTQQVPIESLRPGDHVVSYDIAKRHMHRRGSAVTGVSSRPFYGELVTVKAGVRASRYTPNHHCVVRIADGLDGKHLVYLMRRGRAYRVGRAAARYGAAFGPMMRAQAEQADALWVLGQYDTAEEAAMAEALVSAKFGLPMMLFRAANNRLMSQTCIDDFWLTIGDLTEQAQAALAAYGRSWLYPLWQAGHDRLLIRRTRVMRACNVMDGMKMLDADTEEWHPVAVGREEYAGQVWSMDVENVHTYMGDGLVTHNCQQIYEWRGAIDALDTVPDDVPRTFLTQSWRFGPVIARVANKVLGRLHAPLRLVGNRAVADELYQSGGGPTPRAVLCRTNAAAVQALLGYQERGMAPHLVGGSEDIVRFAEAAIRLQAGERVSHPDLACFETWREVQDYVADDPGGSDLRTMVRMLDDYGPQIVIDALAGLIAEDAADVIISTAHRAKGREWPSVRLGPDFEVQEGAPIPPGELRLLYVACTRARDRLDISACEPMRRILAGVDHRADHAWPLPDIVRDPDPRGAPT